MGTRNKAGLHLLVWVQPLLLKAEALDFVEVLPSVQRDHIVGGDADHCVICWVSCGVESQCCLPWHNLRGQIEEQVGRAVQEMSLRSFGPQNLLLQEMVARAPGETVCSKINVHMLLSGRGGSSIAWLLQCLH